MVFSWFSRLFGAKQICKVLKGDGTWGFVALADGNDLVVYNVRATWFGGADDPEDNGETASGISTKKRPEIQGCALPMNFGPCAGSPLPRLPWGTKVMVTHRKSGKTIIVPVIDLGPAHGTGHALDLTRAAFKVFAPLSEGTVLVDYRIIGAGKKIC